MSEFQYYEFQAIDRPLTRSEIADLRKSSSRAAISSTRFVNHYNYGEFRGNVKKWMENYFDAFLYNSNFGVRRLIFRFPRHLVTTETLKAYCPAENARCRTKDAFTLVEYQVDECDSEVWLEEDSDTLTDLLPLRDDLLNGVVRMLYLGWLLCVQNNVVRPEALEPAVPLGLQALTPALETFVDFIGLDQTLLDSAAEVSSDPFPELCTDDIEACVAGLNSGTKFSFLCRLALGHHTHLGAELRQLIVPDCCIDFFSDAPRRTEADLLR